MRYLVVGYGNIGAKRKGVLGDRCVATVDPFKKVADYAAPEQCPHDHYDAAILAVPNQAKLDLLAYFLRRGKHVLVEKPLIFPDRETAERLERYARSYGAIWYTSYNFRFEPNVIVLRNELAKGTIGQLYRARMFYGNGTVADVAETWRDSRLGVLEDLATHLIDLTGFLFGRFGTDFVVWERRGHELKGVDHCILATADRQIVIECSFLSWKNRWTIEVVGEKGSLHMEGLTKWGPSELVIRRRRFPSGVPEESRSVVEMLDPTWAGDTAHFEEMVRAGQTSCENDWWLSRTILKAATSPVD